MMSSATSAQTYYNFNYIDNGGIPGYFIDPTDPGSYYPGVPPGPSASGTLMVDRSGNIIGISNGTVSNSYADGPITGLLGVGALYSNDNKFISSGSPYYLSLSGFAFYTGAFPGDAYSATNAFVIQVTGSGGSSPYGMFAGDSSSQGAGSLTVSCISGCGDVAPEMNASLIPQVGLLLGCLFFLLGRKKENAEVGLIA